MRDSLVIAQIIGSFEGGGAEKLAYNLGIALSLFGVKSLCIAVRSAGSHAKQGDNYGMEVISLNADRHGFWGKIEAVFRLRALLKKREVDLLHIHGSRTLFFCAIAMIGRQKPILWFTWHDSTSVLKDKGLRKKVLLWAMRRCRRIYGSAKQITEKLAVIPELVGRLSIFRNGVPDSGKHTAEKEEEPVVLWMARIVPNKNPASLIRCTAQLKKEGIRFKVILAGSSYKNLNWFFEETRQLIKRLEVEDIISMPGWVNDENLVLRASIGVQTSDTEGLSIALLEQMMAGLAIVATDVGDTNAVVINEVTGLLIPPRNEDALYTALRCLLTDKELRERLGNAARKKAQEEFSLKSMAERVLKEYKELNG